MRLKPDPPLYDCYGRQKRNEVWVFLYIKTTSNSVHKYHKKLKLFMFTAEMLNFIDFPNEGKHYYTRGLNINI